MQIADILDAAKTKRGLDSDNRLALELVVSRGMVSKWRNGHDAPDVQNAMKLADMAELDRLEVLATCELHREKDPKRRAYWAMFKPGLRRVAALVTAPVVALILSSLHSDQTLTSSKSSGSTDYKFPNFLRVFRHKLISFRVWLFRNGLVSIRGFAPDTPTELGRYVTSVLPLSEQRSCGVGWVVCFQLTDTLGRLPNPSFASLLPVPPA